MEHSSVVCISHAQCMDGFGAAAVLRSYFLQERPSMSVSYCWGQYGKPIPAEAFDADEVYILDFSYPPEELVKLATSSRRPKIVLLDHHKTALQDLKGMRGVLQQYNTLSDVIFDMGRSGTGLTWDWFFPNDHRPPVVTCIQARDLWQDTREDWEHIRHVNAALFSYPYHIFGDLYKIVVDPSLENVQRLAAEGRAIDRKHMKDCHELISHGKQICTWELPDGLTLKDIPFLNVPIQFASDCGNLLAKNAQFAVCYSDSTEHRHFSLRSAKGLGLDVSAVAKLYGGGGHANAAGFKIAHADLQDKLRAYIQEKIQ